MKLKIAKGLSLPIEAVTQTFAILAIKSSGKSYTASVFAEEMMQAGEQCIMVDPTGAWWGLQSSADGKKEGFPVVIFGGDHANVPLEESSGEIIAKAIIENNFSAILDLSLMRKGQANRFMGAFLETLYRVNRNPVHLFVDEADLFAPQKPFGDQARTLGAMEDIVRRGRRRGIGSTLITQRSSVINKDVLTQCDTLITLRLSHPKDINAIQEWINVHADREQSKEMIQSLPSLPTGTAWIWSPSWIKVFQKINIRTRYTFDSGATPKPGERVKAPKKLVQIDLASLGKSIMETIEKQKNENPLELKKKIKQLELELNKKSPAQIPPPAVDNELIKNLKQQNVDLKKQNTIYFGHIKSLKGSLDKIQKLSQSAFNEEIPLIPIPESKFIDTSSFNKNTLPSKTSGGKNIHNSLKQVVKVSPDQRAMANTNDANLGRCERSILTVLAQRNGLISSKSQIAILSGYSSTSGGFKNSISKLRQLNFLMGSGDTLQITDIGIRSVGDYEPLPTGNDLHQYWYEKLDKCSRSILKFLVDCGGSPQAKENVADGTQYSVTSGGFKNSISRLRTLELVRGYGNEIQAAEHLF